MSQNDFYEPKRTLCGSLEEIGPWTAEIQPFSCRILAVFGVWAPWQKILLDLVSSIFFLISFRFLVMILMNKKENAVVVWRKLIHKRPRISHFHDEFQPFWSVGIMTFRPSFFNLLSFFVLFHRMILMNQKENYVVVWRKLFHKQPRFSHFHAKFRLFLEGGHQDKKSC